MSQKINVVILLGFSGVGKSAISRHLSNSFSEYHSVVTNTTRNIRDKEVNGVDYNFLDLEEFKNKIDNNEFVEYQMYGKNYYGMSMDNFDANKINLVVCEPSGVQSLYADNRFEILEIFDIKRDLNVVLETVKNNSDEARAKQIEERRKNKEEEIEIEKLPSFLKKNFKTIDNNSSTLYSASAKIHSIINLNKNIDLKITDMSDENIKSFAENLHKTSDTLIKEEISAKEHQLLMMLKTYTAIILKNDTNKIHYLNKTLTLLDTYNKTFESKISEIDYSFCEDYIKEITPEMRNNFKKFKNGIERALNIDLLPTHSIYKLQKMLILLEQNIKESSLFINKDMYKYLANGYETYNEIVKTSLRTIQNYDVLDNSFIMDKIYKHIVNSNMSLKDRSFDIKLGQGDKQYLINDDLFNIYFEQNPNDLDHRPISLSVEIIDSQIKVIDREKGDYFFTIIDESRVKAFKLNDKELSNILKEDVSFIRKLPPDKQLPHYYTEAIINKKYPVSINFVRNDEMRNNIMEHILDGFEVANQVDVESNVIFEKYYQSMNKLFETDYHYGDINYER